MTTPIPSTNFDEEPTVCIHINELWIPVILGAMHKWLNPPRWEITKNGLFMVNPEPIWEGDETAQIDAEQQILGIMAALMLGNCEEEEEMPTGAISMFYGVTIPTGWLECDGSEVNSVDYPALALALGEEGETFNLPDLRGRFPLGMSEDYAFASNGGAAEHTLTTDEMPAHSHELQAGDGATAFSPEMFVALGNAADWQSGFFTNAAGSDQPHNNMPPYLVVKFIIRT